MAKTKHAPNSKHYRKAADGLWQAIIKRDGYCEKCGECYGSNHDYLDAHHIIHKVGNFTKYRFVLENGIALCRACHGLAELYEADFLSWLKENIPWQYQWQFVARQDKRFAKINYQEEYERLLEAV